MVKVSKIAVWDVDGKVFRDFKAAEQETRAIIIEELMTAEVPDITEVAGWVSANWDNITAKVEKAMAGT